MKTLKNYIIESNIEFPTIKDFKKKSGIISINWKCGNDTLKNEYKLPITGMTDISTLSWFRRNIDKLDTISISIYENNGSYLAYIYIGNEFIAGRGISFEGKFSTAKEAKTKMYDVLCKIRDDKDIFSKLAKTKNMNPDLDFMNYEEFMNL